MRRFVTLGIFSVASVVAWSCGDDDGANDGAAGSGGAGGSAGMGGSGGGGAGAGAGGSAGSSTGGSAGSVGTAGTAGTTGSAGSAGSAGAAGSGTVNDPDAGDAGYDGDSGVATDAGDAAPPPPCTGCLELRAPLAAPGDNAYFQVAFAADDLSDTVVTFRLRSLALDASNQTLIQPFATSFDGVSTYTQGNGTSVQNNAATFTDTETFVDVTLDIGAITTVDFDDTSVVAFGIQLFAGGTYAGPAPHLLLDSISFTGTAGLTDMTFTTDAQGFAVLEAFSIAGTEAIHH